VNVTVTPREVVFHVELSQAEGVGLYWALADICGPASDRDRHASRGPMFALFDKLYTAGASEMSREP